LRKRAQRGFTLIELIISITLVAAISAGLLMTLRTGLQTLERTQTRLEENRRAIGTLDMIRRQIGGAMPVRATCRSGERSIVDDIFRGDPAILLLVTNESLTEGARGYPRIAEYRWTHNPDGTMRLEVRESLFSGVSSTAPHCESGNDGKDAILPSDAPPIVLLDRLAYGRFRYRQLDLVTLLGRDWTEGWDRPTLPFAVRLEMEAAPGNGSRLPVGIITVPLHISREPGANYNAY
jgi:prepilin-type N-terminal cleavage/methylation domain-containing protein